MTIAGVTHQTILSRLVLQSCQLCDVVHDFRYDPSICVSVDTFSDSLQKSSELTDFTEVWRENYY